MINSRIRRQALALPNDVEMLQTDIMRFLAIICMCLMILFALVQSLPLTGENVQPRLQSTALHQQHLEVLRETLKASRDELQELKIEIAQRKQHLADLLNAEKKSREALEQLEDTSASNARAAQQAEMRLTEAETLLNQAEQRLRTAEEQLAQKQLSLSVTEDTLYSAQTRLKKAQAALKDARATLESEPDKPEPPVSKPEPMPEPVPEPMPEPMPEQPPAPEQQGFTLAFDSEDALRGLIADSGPVSLFLIAGGKSWRLRSDTGKPWAFVPEPAPKTLYEMEITSVPYQIRAAAKKVFAAYGGTKPFYGVRLPRSMDNEIRSLMSNRSGGNLIIGSAGEVRIQ